MPDEAPYFDEETMRKARRTRVKKFYDAPDGSSLDTLGYETADNARSEYARALMERGEGKDIELPKDKPSLKGLKKAAK